MNAFVHQRGERDYWLLLANRPFRHLLNLKQPLDPTIAGQRFEMQAELVPDDRETANLAFPCLGDNRVERLQNAASRFDPGLTGNVAAEIWVGSTEQNCLSGATDAVEIVRKIPVSGLDSLTERFDRA